ncbi:hypothetical protein KCU87_g80, partial [Aureobasidium melanogenum]
MVVPQSPHCKSQVAQVGQVVDGIEEGFEVRFATRPRTQATRSCFSLEIQIEAPLLNAYLREGQNDQNSFSVKRLVVTHLGRASNCQQCRQAYPSRFLPRLLCPLHDSRSRSHAWLVPAYVDVIPCVMSIYHQTIPHSNFSRTILYNEYGVQPCSKPCPGPQRLTRIAHLACVHHFAPFIRSSKDSGPSARSWL